MRRRWRILAWSAGGLLATAGLVTAGLPIVLNVNWREGYDPQPVTGNVPAEHAAAEVEFENRISAALPEGSAHDDAVSFLKGQGFRTASEGVRHCAWAIWVVRSPKCPTKYTVAWNRSGDGKIQDLRTKIDGDDFCNADPAVREEVQKLLLAERTSESAEGANQTSGPTASHEIDQLKAEIEALAPDVAPGPLWYGCDP